MSLVQNTIYARTFLMVLSSDGKTGATGKLSSLVVNLRKPGGTFGAAGGVLTEVGLGWYQVALTAIDTNTVGDLDFNCTASLCDSTDFRETVGYAPVNVAQWVGSAPNALVTGRVDASVGAIAAGLVTLKRNVAYTFTFPMFDVAAPNGLVAGKTVTVKTTLDGGAVANATNGNPATEISGGEYKLVLTAAEMNGIQVSGTMTAAGCLDQAFCFLTQP